MQKLNSIKKVHQGSYLTYYELNYTNLAGEEKIYEMVSKNRHLDEDPSLIGKNLQAVVLLVLDKTHGKLLISKEYRMGVNDYVYNMGAGLIDEGETPEEAAARELREETGLTLTRVMSVEKPSFGCAPITDDLSTLIICEAEGKIRESDNPNEEIYSRWYTKAEAASLLMSDARLAARLQAFIVGWLMC